MADDPPPTKQQQTINIIDDAIDYWAMFIMVHGQGEDAEVSVWTLMAELDTIKEKINELYNGS